MKRTYLDVELADGTVHEAVRVLAADRIRAAKIARTNGVPLDDSPEIAEYLAFAATTRTGLVSAEDLGAWRPQVADFASAEHEPEQGSADPTQPAPAL